MLDFTNILELLRQALPDLALSEVQAEELWTRLRDTPALPGQTYDRALYLWFIGLPFSVFGFVWLTFRLGQANGEKYLQYEARHPVLTAWLRVGLPLAGGLALAGLIAFLTHR
jgi:hypothetical protein